MSLNVVYPIHVSPSSVLQVQQKNMERIAQSIASGIQSQINPADSYVASGLDSSIRSAHQAMANAQMGYNFVATADSALANVTQNLQRIRELSIQASNGIYSGSQVSAMQAEINQNADQIRQTLSNATFNGKLTLNAVTPENPNAVGVMDIMVGENSTQTISYDPNITLGSMNFDISTPEAASDTLKKVDEMLDDISSKRGEIGAVQTSFEGAIEQQSANILSYASSLSDIQDTDYVSAIAELKKSQFAMEAFVKVMKVQMDSQDYILDLLKQV